MVEDTNMHNDKKVRIIPNLFFNPHTFQYNPIVCHQI